jgi:hypothetical protein
MTISEASLLVVHGGVVSYFLQRFVRYRRWASIGVALLPLGWICVVAQKGLGPMGEELMRWFGVVLGAFLLVMVITTDRHDLK